MGGGEPLLDSNSINPPSCSTATTTNHGHIGRPATGHSQSTSSQSSGTRQQTQTFQQLVARLASLISPKDGGVSSGGGVEKRFAQIQAIFKQLKQLFLAEESQNRRQAGIQVLHNAYEILAHLIFLKSGCVLNEGLAPYVERTLKALKQTTSLSHDQYVGPVRALENRKLQVSLCLVESLTELFVQDVDTFGLQVECYEKCGRIRREIANALLNLVYQQRDAKLRLCSNLAFLRRVADTIAQVHSLDQYYAGLVQNVSYNADKKAPLPFAHHLAITVHPLVHVATLIMRDGYQQQNQSMDQQQKQRLYKILSALWNLAEDPIENKRVMCHDHPAFVPFLLHIMLGDARDVGLIQSATGILKHLCAFILQYPELFSKTLGAGAIRALLHQLYSSSADLIIDALLALSILCKHPYAAQELLSHRRSFQDIEYLTKNTNEGIVRATRALMDTVNSVYYQVLALQQHGMCNSVVGGWNPAATAGGANGTDQTNFAGPFVGQQHQQQQQYYNTLPKAMQSQQQIQRHPLFDPSKAVGKDKEYNHHHQPPPQETPKGTLKQQQQKMGEGNRENLVEKINNKNDTISGDEREEEDEQADEDGDGDGFINEPCIEAGQDLATSVQCTRAQSSEGTPHSGGSVNDVRNGEEWPSVRSTSVNSRRTSGADSPASASELPDSPSQCASHKPFQLEAMALVIKKALEDEGNDEDNEKDTSGGNFNEDLEQSRGPNVSGSSSTEASSKEGGRKGEKVANENCENTDSGGTLVDGGEDGGEDATNGSNSVNDNFLDEVIRNYMPKPLHSAAVVPDTDPPPAPYQLLDSMIMMTMNNNNNNPTPILTPISTNSPGKSPVRRDENRGGKRSAKSSKKNKDHLLEDSIASMMPTKPRIHQQQMFQLPADVDADFNAQWVVVNCGGCTSPPQKPSSTSNNNEDRSRFVLRKTSSQSSIPRPLPTTPSKRTKDKSAGGTGQTPTCSAPKQSVGFNKSPEATQIPSSSQSPQKRIQSAPTATKKPPPLAPKPNFTKIKDRQAGTAGEWGGEHDDRDGGKAKPNTS